MDRKQLPKDFFKSNPLNKMSAAIIGDFKYRTRGLKELNEKIETIVKSNIEEDRNEKIVREKEVIDHIDNADALVSFMRKRKEMMLDYLLLEKARSFEKDAAPLILKRYKSSGMDSFIELSVQILSVYDMRYTEQLLSEYRDIRNPYAQAQACLLFGERQMDEAAPLLLAEYERFQRDFFEKDYDQFPLLALYILCGEAYVS